MSNKERALKLRLDGLSYQAIGEQLGISRQRVQQLVSPPKEIRHYVINRAEGKCQACGIVVGSSGHVHHQNSTNGDNFNDIDNLQLLCPSCHMAAHYGDGPAYTCRRCDHKWRGRPFNLEQDREKPVRCPNCQSKSWDKKGD